MESEPSQAATVYMSAIGVELCLPLFPVQHASPMHWFKPEAFSHDPDQHKDRVFMDRIVAACIQGAHIGYRGPRLYSEHENWPSVYNRAAAVIASIEKDIQATVTIEGI